MDLKAHDCFVLEFELRRRQILGEDAGSLICCRRSPCFDQTFLQMFRNQWSLISMDLEQGVIRGGSAVARATQAKLSSNTWLDVRHLASSLDALRNDRLRRLTSPRPSTPVDASPRPSKARLRRLKCGHGNVPQEAGSGETLMDLA
jgi:hypothetical protein